LHGHYLRTYLFDMITVISLKKVLPSSLNISCNYI
jgi:hypothetical protein